MEKRVFDRSRADRASSVVVSPGAITAGLATRLRLNAAWVAAGDVIAVEQAAAPLDGFASVDAQGVAPPGSATLPESGAGWASTTGQLAVGLDGLAAVVLQALLPAGRANFPAPLEAAAGGVGLAGLAAG